MRYIARKTLVLLITLFMISLLTFAAFAIIPGDPARLILGTEATEEKLQALRVQLGTDLPLWKQYLRWISGFVMGNFGTSVRYGVPVAGLLADRVRVTLIMGAMVLVLVLAAGIPLGILAGYRSDTLTGHVLDFLSMIGMSFPGFFLSILFMWIFGLVLKLFTPGRFIPYESDPAGFFRFLFFPALSIALPETAILAKYIRAAVVDELTKDYARTARGKGAGTIRILFTHILRNAIIGVLPLIGMMIGSIFSGSIIVEQVYGIPGVGRLLIASVTARDFPLTQTLVMYVAVVIVLTNFAVDILIQVIDPRIRLD